MKFHNIIKEINEAKSIGITYHVSPDGDATGSALSLLQALRVLNKNVQIFSKEKVSDNLKYINLSNEITGENFKVSNNVDLLIVVDCGNMERISADLSDYSNAIINIDHHMSNDNYGKENYIDTTASATCEIIYELINEMNINITNEIATAIYTGLVTDTGSFRHSNVTERTHKIASEIIALKINNSAIHTELFDNKEYSKIKLIGKVLDNMKLVKDRKVAVMKISKTMLDEVGAELDDTSDIISFGLKIKGVEVAILLKEADENVKVSLRAKTYYNVRVLAEQFGGGGHEKASGLKINNVTLDEAEKLILNAMGDKV